MTCAKVCSFWYYDDEAKEVLCCEPGVYTCMDCDVHRCKEHAEAEDMSVYDEDDDDPPALCMKCLMKRDGERRNRQEEAWLKRRERARSRSPRPERSH
jgi:hypothetical protein